MPRHNRGIRAEGVERIKTPEGIIDPGRVSLTLPGFFIDTCHAEFCRPAIPLLSAQAQLVGASDRLLAEPQPLSAQRTAPHQLSIGGQPGSGSQSQRRAASVFAQSLHT